MCMALPHSKVPLGIVAYIQDTTSEVYQSGMERLGFGLGGEDYNLPLEWIFWKNKRL